MALVYNSTTDKWTDSITIEKQNNSKLTLATNETYVNGNIEFTIGVKSGSAIVNTGQSITEDPEIKFTATNTLKASYSGSKSITGSSSAGWIGANAVTSATVTTSGETTVSLLTLPSTYSFTMNMEANTTADQSALTINNANYRKVDIDNKVTTNSRIRIKAKEQSGSSTTTDWKIIVDNGVWETTTISAADTYYYGRVKASKGVLSTSVSTSSGSASLSATGCSFLSSGTSDFYVTLTTSAGSATPSATVSTPGYVTSSENITASSATSVSVTGNNTKKYLPKIVGTLGKTGTLKYTPTISKQSTPSGVTIVNANASGNATTSPTTNGVYAVVKAAGGTNNITPTISITTAGYGTNTNHSITGSAFAVGANDSAITYIPITLLNSITFTAGALNNKEATISSTTNIDYSDTTNNSGVTITCSGKAGCAATTYTNTAGWFAAHSSSTSTGKATSASTWTGTTYYINGVTIGVSKNFDITIPNGSTTPNLTLNFAVDSNGNVLVT